MKLEFPEFDSRLFDLMQESSTGGTYLYMADLYRGNFLWSREAVEYFDLPGVYVEGMVELWLQKIHPEDREAFLQDIQDILDGKTDRHSCEYRARNSRGEYVWLQCRGKAMRDDFGRPVMFAGTMTNLGTLAKFDSITNLLNIYEFRRDLHELTLQTKEVVGILVFGIDNFSYINERHTYSFGNQVLKSYADKIQKATFKGGTLYRMDGDKFVLIARNAERSMLEEQFEKYQRCAQEGMDVGDIPVMFSISGGGTFYPQDGANEDILHRNLEYALERSKIHGRKHLTFFSNELLEESLRKIDLMEALRDSVHHGFSGFYLCYQPIVDAVEGNLLSCEALLRWSGKHFGQISPMEFIPLLEETGDIYEAGQWVVTEALQQLKEWQKTLPELQMNINVSYIQCKNPQFKHFVIEEKERLGLKDGSLVLELTESCKIIDAENLRKEIQFFQDHGILMALDDFGTGYASLSILKELPADWVKIDHGFVSKIKDEPTDKAIIEHLIALCQQLGISVCVEGVETEGIGNMVKLYAPNSLQGYFYSRPVQGEEFFERFIKKEENL